MDGQRLGRDERSAPTLTGGSLAGSSAETWNALYGGVAPWDTGRPQPAFVRLAEEGRLAGRVLDAGCGTGATLCLQLPSAPRSSGSTLPRAR